jgi:hypothetical protein
LERRIYEIARKHCGTKAVYPLGLDKLQAKCGSSSTAKEFRRLVQNIARQDEQYGHMPDYGIRIEGSQVIFTNRRVIEPKMVSPALSSIRLDPEAYHDGRQAAPGWDIYVLEQEWRSWMMEMDSEPPRNPTRAFVGFCRKWFETRGHP